MRRGFFTGSELSKSSGKGVVSYVPKCGACGLHKFCHSPKMEVSGKGKRKILIVGEAPGQQEDAKGKAFVGPSGRQLRDALGGFGIDLYEDCWLTNSLICRPKDNRDPSPKELDYCRPNLAKVLRDYEPEVIIPLGRFGIKSLMKLAWKEDPKEANRWLGWRIPCQKLNAWICPTYHPAFILRKLEEEQKGRTSIEVKYWRHHLERASELIGRPWKEVPDYKKQVELITDPTDAAKIIREFIWRGGTVAFDYETTMLKPEHDNAAIVSCSVCWEGVRTIAYPWHGQTIEATKELLVSPLRKIASNLKFEERWSRFFLKTPVRNWLWDTMIGGHILDNREDITSIKFQAFIHLGAESYDDHIKKYLKAKKGVKVNQILEEISMNDLLLYNGLDSLLEFLVAKKQMKLMKIPFPKPSVVQ